MRQRWSGRRVVTLAGLGLGLGLAAPATADACTCAIQGPVPESLASSDAVFEGVVRSVELAEKDLGRPRSGLQIVRFDIARRWKGDVTATQDVFTYDNDAACGFRVLVGERYLVYARRPEGRLTMSLCSRSKPSQSTAGAEDLALLGPGEPPLPNPIAETNPTAAAPMSPTTLGGCSTAPSRSRGSPIALLTIALAILALAGRRAPGDRAIRSSRPGRAVVAAAVLGIGLSLVMVRAAHACSCLPPPTVPESLAAAAAVFEGVARGSEPAPNPGGVQGLLITVRFEVTRRWKGDVTATQQVLTPSNSAACGVGVVAGQSYLIYAGRQPDGALTMNLCSRTNLSANAAQDLALLGAAQPPLPDPIPDAGPPDTNPPDTAPVDAPPVDAAPSDVAPPITGTSDAAATADPPSMTLPGGCAIQRIDGAAAPLALFVALGLGWLVAANRRRRKRIDA